MERRLHSPSASKPLQDPRTDGTVFLRSRGNNLFQELFYSSQNAANRRSPIFLRGKRCFSVRHRLPILSVRKRGRRRGGGWVGRRGRGCVVTFQHREGAGLPVSPAAALSGLSRGMCDLAALLPWARTRGAGARRSEGLGGGGRRHKGRSRSRGWGSPPSPRGRGSLRPTASLKVIRDGSQWTHAPPSHQQTEWFPWQRLDRAMPAFGINLKYFPQPPWSRFCETQVLQGVPICGVL